MTKNDTVYAEHGFERFYMVAAMPKPGDPPLTDEQQKEFQPHVRHPTHRSALREAHRLAALFGSPFVVLRSSTLAIPAPEADGAQRAAVQQAADATARMSAP